MRSSLAQALLASLPLAAPLPAGAGLGEHAASAEREVEALGEQLGAELWELPVMGALLRRIRLSGDAVGAFVDAGSGSELPGDHWNPWDIRAFADVQLAEEARLHDHELARSVRLRGEWQLYRLGEHESELGDLYVEMLRLLGSRWLDVRIGRFQIPVGENYLRFGRGSRDNPFVTNTVGGPWWHDEGVRFHGAAAERRFGYTLSLTGGETPRIWDYRDGDQVTLKLFAKPAQWLYLSASSLYGGRLGKPGNPAEAALWLGETWARGVPTKDLPFLGPGIDGVQELDHTFYVGGDAVVTLAAGARLWLSYGRYEFDSEGPRAFDRRLHSWVVELALEGRLIAPGLRAFYLALRASGLGGYDDDQGYVLDRRSGDALGPTMRSLEAYSIATGWRLLRRAVLKLEYSVRELELVRDARRRGLRVDDDDFLIVSLGLHF